jgi:hypothetical protein
MEWKKLNFIDARLSKKQRGVDHSRFAIATLRRPGAWLTARHA